ncbi:MAG TPA: 30S ribosomal protein S7, partial [Candidatus Eremiobacteraeota bacterium]|nr:30S ribosomal protein S7 [Candidatus Eremiobacteraeota bacterium]
MSRKGSIPKREIMPDPIYNSRVVARFINKIMLKGKKSLAERIFYGALEIVGEKTKKNPLEVFEQAMDNVIPLLEVRA